MIISFEYWIQIQARKNSKCPMPISCKKWQLALMGSGSHGLDMIMLFAFGIQSPAVSGWNSRWMQMAQRSHSTRIGPASLQQMKMAMSASGTLPCSRHALAILNSQSLFAMRVLHPRENYSL